MIKFSHITRTIYRILSKEKFDLIILGAKGRSSLFDATLFQPLKKIGCVGEEARYAD